MVLVCNNRDGAEQVLAGLDEMNFKPDQTRLNKLRGHPQLTYQQLKNNQRWIEVEKEITSPDIL